MIKKASDRTVKSEIMSNKELAEELHKPVIRKILSKEKHTDLLLIIFGTLI